MNIKNNTISISDARANLPELVDKVDQYMSTYNITVNGNSKAILISAEEYESLIETIEVLSIPGIVDEVKKAKEEIKNGAVVPFEDIDNV